MLRLIRRELEDYMLLLLTAAIVATVFVCITITSITTGRHGSRLEIWIPNIMFITFFTLWFLPVAFALIGTAQMHVDKIRKVPAFLATLATNRSQILSAKIIAGIIYILVATVPILVTDIILMRTYYPASVAGVGIFLKMFGLLFLACLMGYAVGLQAGTSTSKIVAVLGPIVTVPFLISIAVFKGLDGQTAGLFAIITIAVLIRVWQKFKTSSL